MTRMHRDASRVALLGLACSALLACPGPAGQPCTVKDNGDQTSTISCPDGTSVTVKNGATLRNFESKQAGRKFDAVVFGVLEKG